MEGWARCHLKQKNKTAVAGGPIADRLCNFLVEAHSHFNTDPGAGAPLHGARLVVFPKAGRSAAAAQAKGLMLDAAAE